MAAEVDKSTDPGEPPAPTTGTGRSAYIGIVLGDRYRLVRPLGHGGMGSVYFAEHTQLGKPLAVKVLDSRYLEDQHGEERLFREARAAAAIGHQNIIDVIDVGTSPFGDPYLVMEYLQGEDLASYAQRETPMTCGAACAVLGPILEALNAAHAKGIVHRDIKPANIFLVARPGYPPIVKLIDFGIAKTLGRRGEPPITVGGALLGTPSYMSPEQARGSTTVDERADLYAVGIVFYQMLTGRLPFDGANYNETLFKIINEAPEQPDSVVSGLPADALAFIEKAIAKDPAERYQSAEKMLRAMQLLWAWSAREDAMAALATRLQPRAVSVADATIDVAQTPSTVVSPQFEGGDRREEIIIETPEDWNESHGNRQDSSEQSAKSRDIPATENLPPTRASVPNLPPDSAAAAPSLRPVDTDDTDSKTRLPPSSESDTRAHRRWLVPATLGALVGLLWLFWPKGEEPAAPAQRVDVEPATSAAPSQPIQITLLGIPETAVVRIDGTPVAGNPLGWPRSDALVTIEVEADGFLPFTTNLVPSQDVTLPIRLSARPVETSTSDAPGQTDPKPQHRPSPAPGANTIGKSGRDSLYYEKFE